VRISDYQWNRLRLLKAIRGAEPVARTDLVTLTGLSAGTITQLTADLLSRGVLIEERSATGSVGRPRVGLRINAASGYVVGVFTGGDLISVEVVNLRGDLVFEQAISLRHTATLEGWARQLAAAVDRAIDASRLPRSKIHCIGIVVQGIVDNIRGVVHWLATFPDRGVQVAALVRDRLGIPVVIDNDANIIARAEHWFGDDRPVDNFSIIVVHLGVSAAHFVDGVLRTGANGINSEFGHVKVISDANRECFCGAKGCLGAYCAIFGIVTQVYELRRKPRPPYEKHLEVFRRLVVEARAGDPVVRETFERAGRLLGIAAANMINDHDPGRLTIMAFEPDLLALLSDAISAAMQANILPAFAERTQRDFKLLGENHFRKGSAALALEQVYLSRGKVVSNTERHKARSDNSQNRRSALRAADRRRRALLQ